MNRTRIPTPARSSDPETSGQAADSVNRFTGRLIHNWILLRLYQLHLTRGRVEYHYTHEGLRLAYDLTNNAYKVSESGFRTRCSELVHAGLVKDSGLRTPILSGRNAVVWHLTTEGIDFVGRLREPG